MVSLCPPLTSRLPFNPFSYNYQSQPGCDSCGKCQPELLVFKEWILQNPAMECVIYLLTEASILQLTLRTLLHCCIVTLLHFVTLPHR